MIKEYPGFSLDYRDDIYIYTVRDITRDAVDAWYETDKAQAETAAATHRHARRMLIFEKMIFPTPYFTKALRQSNAETPDGLYESTALVMPDGFAMRAMRLMLNRDLVNPSRNARALFLTQQEGQDWLAKRHELVLAHISNESHNEVD